MYSYHRVLVTGGAGFIGSHIVDRLLECRVDVVVLDNLSGGRLENIRDRIGKRNFRFIQGDIRDFGSVKESVGGTEVVFHQAALIGAPQSIDNPILGNEINADGTLNLLKAALDSNVRRFIFASSCAAYGNTGTLPIKEH